MLQTLKQYDKDEAQDILVAAINRLSPDPWIDETDPSEEVDEAVAQSVIAEVKTKLKLNPNDRSYQSRCDVLGRLSDEICDYVITSKNAAEIKDRLGDKGLLSTSQYEIDFGAGEVGNVARKIHKGQIIDAIKNPSAIEHLTPESVGENKNFQFTISVKYIERKDAKDNYFLLVNATRNGARFTAEDAWYVFPTDLELPNTPTPLTLLEAFIRKYGMEFTLGDNPPTKYARDQIIYNNHNAPVTSLIKTPDAYKHPFQFIALVKDHRALKLSHVSIAYCIDTVQYYDDLALHGIKVDPTLPPQM